MISKYGVPFTIKVVSSTHVVFHVSVKVMLRRMGCLSGHEPEIVNWNELLPFPPLLFTNEKLPASSCKLVYTSDSFNKAVTFQTAAPPTFLTVSKKVSFSPASSIAS
ncbi:MAG: hypothetical protein GYA24_24630 [Candidatus Lokiarchaeota archaeon]|nr:hypothetical protein [Candidatus Lokiarchaeota archaeon]